MDLNLREYGYSGLNFPITVNIGALPTQVSRTFVAQFGAFISAYLSSSKALEANTALEAALAAEPLSTYSRHLINQVIQEIADESAASLASELLPKIQTKLGIQQATAEEVAAAEMKDNLANFVQESLSAFYGAGDERVNRVIQEAVEKGDELVEKYQIEKELVPKLAQIGLYDLIVLCDDSGSMGAENRIAGLKDAVLRLYEIATAVNSEGGLTLRCFDNPNLTGLDNIASEDALRQKLDEIKFNTGYGVPAPLMEKILKPLASKARNRQLENPAIIVVITDGGASSEEAAALSRNIESFKADLQANNYTGPAVSILLCRVGTDAAADEFFGQLEGNANIQDTLLCCKDDLSAKMVQHAGDSGKYTGELFKLLTEALNLQSK
ncbi:hypothetical protein L873DRAFT_1789941 [Choiromyces venosus 120613-1]|uniref:VWFA domain-containing protein n=1 Tax=Choiromyces venosus 120613-1 TaxID=1336337 RepID=A0A3N4JKM2_9PEZI|nr:hypothetical protein L873DRAFT_1789941 [Choiromyces venosus 120613-1]